MDGFVRELVWRQFGAAIDMLENAVVACPYELWSDRSQRPEYWHVVFHTLFFLDYYLSDSPDGFTPPAPFTLTELDPAGVLPDRVYTKAELLTYLERGRAKCHATIGSMTAQKSRERQGFLSGELCVFELMLYNLRHVQHHAAQLNLILRHRTDSAPGWVRRAKAITAV